MPATLRSSLGKITRQADRRAAKAVRTTIVDIQVGAAIRSRVRTGNMQRGWHAEMIDTHVGVVNNLVDYTVFNERGTFHPARVTTSRVGPLTVHHVSRPYRIGAQPMLAPAVAEARPKFIAEMGRVYR